MPRLRPDRRSSFVLALVASAAVSLGGISGALGDDDDDGLRLRRFVPPTTEPSIGERGSGPAWPDPPRVRRDERGMIARLGGELLRKRVIAAHEALDELLRFGPGAAEVLEEEAARLRFEAHLREQLGRWLRVNGGAGSTDLPGERTPDPGGRRRAAERRRQREREAAEKEFFATRYELAVDRFIRGDFLGTIRLADALLALDPRSELRNNLQRLKQKARQRMVHEHVVRVTIEPLQGRLDPKSAALARITIENKSDRPVLIAHDGSGESDLFGVLQVDFAELGLDGRRRRVRLSRTIKAIGEVTLGPGDKHELTVELGKLHLAHEPGAFARYSVSGRLRPQLLRHGDEILPYFLPIFATDLAVPDPELAPPPGRRPIDVLRQAIFLLVRDFEGLPAKIEKYRKVASRAFHAALHCEEGQVEEVLGLLIAGMRRTAGEVQTILHSAVQHASGEERTFSPEDWATWWEERRARAARDRAAEHARDRERLLPPEDEEPTPAGPPSPKAAAGTPGEGEDGPPPRRSD